MDIVERVRRHASDVIVEVSYDAIASVTRFEAGDRHAVYRVTYVNGAGGTDDVVVRVSTGADAAERIQAGREAAVLDALRGVGAPRLIDFRTDSRWLDTPTLCMEFIEGEHRELMAAPPEDLEQLGAVVASVHDGPVGDLLDRFSGP